MVEIKDFDADSYELEFEEDTVEDERRFYVTKYPNVNMVADARLHCTTCNTHLGCAVANELNIRMHPVLRVTHCKKCHTFYNSGEFSKGEDGSELYCRWCGQGGEVYCCSKCPYVFCKKCIVQNMPRGKINDIENNDNWNCFSCAPREMWDLRAQHWALVNYIEKTKKKIVSEEKDDDKIYELMNKDPTLCCRDKKSQKRKDTKRKRKRRYSSSTTSSGCSTPEPKRIQDHSAVLPKMVRPTVQQKAAKQLDELVCTPDILSMFETAEEPPPRVAPSKQPPSKAPSSKTPSSKVPPSKAPTQATANFSSSQKSAASQPPPLIIRQLPTTPQTVRFPNRQFQAVPRAAPPQPAYYTVNGFRVDLNAAAQQDTYRLPNGKLIQVKKQTAVNAANPTNAAANRNALPVQPRSNATANTNPYSIRFNVQPGVPTQPIQIHPQHQTLHQTHLQQQQQILNGMNSVPVTPMNTMTTPNNISNINPMNNINTMNTINTTINTINPMNPMTTMNAINTLPTPLPIVNKYPKTPLGEAQSQLEHQIHQGQEICQHINGKLNNLMKSTAYKTVRNYNDVKELHLHLSYLYTYTIDRFKTMHEKCAEDMKVLSNAHEAANKLADKKNKYTNVDDDLEVVEPTTICIEIESDDDNEPKSPKNPKSPKSNNSAFVPIPPEDPIISCIPIVEKSKKTKQPRKTSLQPKPNDLQPMPIVNELAPIEISETIDADEFELPTPPALESPPSIDIEDVNETYDRDNDEKLKCLPKVVLEVDEAVERKLKEIMEKVRNGSVSPIDIDLSENDEHDDSTNGFTKESVDDCAKESVDESAKESLDECAKESVDETAKRTTDKCEKESTDDSSSESIDECPKESIDECPKESIDECAKESVDECAKESVDECAKESVDECAKESIDECAKESVDECAKDSVDECAKDSVDECAMDSVDDSTEIETESIRHSVKESAKRTDGEPDEMLDECTVIDDDEKNADEAIETHKVDNKVDDVTNGQKNDESITNDLSRSDSPALTDNLENELLDDLDNQQSGLTDNSFENISSPDMFDDMSKNGFDKPDINMVHLSTENADPDLV